MTARDRLLADVAGAGPGTMVTVSAADVADVLSADRWLYQVVAADARTGEITLRAAGPAEFAEVARRGLLRRVYVEREDAQE